MMRGLDIVTRKPEMKLWKSVPLLCDTGFTRSIGFDLKVNRPRHTETSHQRIDDVAQSSTQSCDKTAPAVFVQSTLHTKYSHRTHWSRHDHTDYHALDNHVEKAYVLKPINGIHGDAFYCSTLRFTVFSHSIRKTTVKKIIIRKSCKDTK